MPGKAGVRKFSQSAVDSILHPVEVRKFYDCIASQFLGQQLKAGLETKSMNIYHVQQKKNPPSPYLLSLLFTEGARFVKCGC